MTSKEKEDREKAMNHRGPKRKYIHAENIPLPNTTITANNHRSQRIRIKSTKHTSSVNDVVSLKEKDTDVDITMNKVNSLKKDNDNNMESEAKKLNHSSGNKRKGR